MILPPKTLFWRLLIWTGLLVWAVWRMRQAPPEPAEPPPEEAVPTVAPDSVLWTAPSGAAPAAPPVVDVVAAMAAMDAAEKASAACHSVGKLSIELGSAGLTRVRFEGAGERPCLLTAVQAQRWPSTLQSFELERELGLRRAGE
jgi:hypothetical protein